MCFGATLILVFMLINVAQVKITLLSGWFSREILPPRWRHSGYAWVWGSLNVRFHNIYAFSGSVIEKGGFKHPYKRVFIINYPNISSPADPEDHHVPMYYECVGNSFPPAWRHGKGILELVNGGCMWRPHVLYVTWSAPRGRPPPVRWGTPTRLHRLRRAGVTTRTIRLIRLIWLTIARCKPRI